jgi:virginiamycin B lyase
MHRMLLPLLILLAACQSAPGPAPALPQDQVIQLPPNSRPGNLVLAKDGALWVSEWSIDSLARIDPDGSIRQYKLKSGPGNGPYEAVQGPDGQMWFNNGSYLHRVDLAGNVTAWQQGHEKSTLFLEAITIGPDGAVWAGKGATPDGKIARFVPEQLPTVIAKFPAEGQNVGGITTGPDGALWFTQYYVYSASEAIGRVSTDGKYQAWQMPLGTGPRQIVSGPDGALWFTETMGIGRITVDGQITHFEVPDGRAQRIVPGPDKALWFTTETQLGRMTTDGKITTWPVPGAKMLTAVLPDGQGAFWITDVDEAVVHRFRPGN